MHRFFIAQRIISARMYRLLGPINVALQPEEAFNIKKGYHSASRAETFDDRFNKDEWQRSVYELVLQHLKEINAESVIDVGCGSAYKLMAIFKNYDTTGIELSDTCHWLKEQYPSRKWLAFEQLDPSSLKSDMVICSDVIEHVKNPDEMMDFLSRMQFKSLVISTPERDSVRGKHDFGPPENTTHYREWNAGEFNDYVSKWFIVDKQVISHDKSASQILFCTKRLHDLL